MKILITICAAILMTASVFAQSPEKMSYQAILRDASNVLVTTKAVRMKISILQDSANGETVYAEIQTPSTNANGLVSLEIGSGTPVTNTFESIKWANGLYFIKTETDLSGGSNYTITGTSQLLSVPYALHAKTAESAESVTGASGFTHYIGELYGGGIVVSVWKKDGTEMGLIASLENINSPFGPQAQYSYTIAYVGTKAQSHNDGQANTTAIAKLGDTNCAANLCDSYSSGGYSDWYLPAAWELNQCYNAAFVVNTILGSSGFALGYYWSSTEESSGTLNKAWYQNFTEGQKSYETKNQEFYVRAVRRF